MSLKLITDLTYGNATAVEIDETGETPEVRFAADPHGGPEGLWFCFRLVETQPDPQRQTKVRLVLKHFDGLLGGTNPTDCLPVCQPAGQAWARLKHGEEQRRPDGHCEASWLVPHPNPSTDIAFCYPYGQEEVDTLIDRSKGYWHQDAIGVSQGGRSMVRLSNAYGSSGREQPGLYLIARQHSGETPGAWVLDGILQYFSRTHRAGFTVWAVPLANIDGVVQGDYGKDNFPYDVNRAWGVPPMRRETGVIKRDLALWKERCRPLLALDLHAPGACEKDGVYCFLPDPNKEDAALSTEAAKWANAFRNELKAEYAASDFRRIASYASRWETPTFAQCLIREYGVCAFTMEIPYALVGGTVLTKKHYREIGQRIGVAMVRRHGAE